MNEYIAIRFQRNGKPWRVRRQVPGGVEFDEPDPLHHTVGIGFDAADDITKYRMRRIRQLQGWEPNQFKLALAVEDGAIVLRGVTPLALPGRPVPHPGHPRGSEDTGIGENRLVCRGQPCGLRHRAFHR